MVPLDLGGASFHSNEEVPHYKGMFRPISKRVFSLCSLSSFSLSPGIRLLPTSVPPPTRFIPLPGAMAGGPEVASVSLSPAQTGSEGHLPGHGSH